MCYLSILPRRHSDYLSKNARKIELIRKAYILGNPVDRLLSGVEIVACSLHSQVLDECHGRIAGHLLEQLDNSAGAVVGTDGKALEGDIFSEMALRIGNQVFDDAYSWNVQGISSKILLFIGERENQGGGTARCKQVSVGIPPGKRGEHLCKQTLYDRLRRR